MNPIDVAWAAGLFEGEGCITIFDQKHNVLPLIRLQVQMTDRDVVAQFCDVVECGKVSGPKRVGRPNRKPVYVWAIGNRKDVERILLAFLPWFGERRAAKAQLTLAEIAKLDMMCDECGTVFRSHRISSRFCSIKCRNRWHYMQNRPAERPSLVGRPRTL